MSSQSAHFDTLRHFSLYTYMYCVYLAYVVWLSDNREQLWDFSSGLVDVYRGHLWNCVMVQMWTCGEEVM